MLENLWTAQTRAAPWARRLSVEVDVLRERRRCLAGGVDERSRCGLRLRLRLCLLSRVLHFFTLALAHGSKVSCLMQSYCVKMQQTDKGVQRSAYEKMRARLYTVTAK